MPRKLPVTLRRETAITVQRAAVSGPEKLVYVIVAKKKLAYPHSKSRVAYIGTTKEGNF